MKLMRIGPPGAEKPALLHDDGTWRDLSGVVGDIDGSAVCPAGLTRIGDADPLSLPRLDPGQRIGACLGGVGNFLCIGLNYADHAAESGMPVPEEPILFSKSTAAICGPDDDLVIPRGSRKTDWEVELGVVIGTEARHVTEADAMDHVAGFCLVNDVSERSFQTERGGQWIKGKSADTFGPIGPWFATRDEIADPQDLSMWLEVDGHRYQDGSTRTMIFGVAFLVSYLSRFMTLKPGDLISTGTPPGVGMGVKPDPVYLVPGQQLRAGIAGLGEQNQRTVAST